MKNFINERSIGRVIAISNYKITVLLDPEIRSQVRAYSERTAIVTQIGGYLIFPVAPGVHTVGIIVGASEDETIEPDIEKGMTLQLTRSRRILRINLVGQLIEISSEKKDFETGVSFYPTLETPALFPNENELRLILEFVPKKEKENIALEIGLSPIYARQDVTVSYNDILGRPFGIIGNTGSGKSYSVASMIQKAKEKAEQAKFIILDINGEYLNAFFNNHLIKNEKKDLNAVYINGKLFLLPLWVFNLNELTLFFEASSASQVPVLERVITSIREDTIDPDSSKPLREIIRLIDECLENFESLHGYILNPTGTFCGNKVFNIIPHLKSTMKNITELIAEDYEGFEIISKFSDDTDLIERIGISDHYIPPDAVACLKDTINKYFPILERLQQQIAIKGGIISITSDSPISFNPQDLLKDELYNTAISRYRGQERIQEYIATLRLRIHKQLSDRRWEVFTKNPKINFKKIIDQMIGTEDSDIIVVDCSMLAYDVLPFFCSIFGRILLELRSHSSPENRTDQPFVLILEEAHNYLKPFRSDESFGSKLSRETFERIAKEGRKFGLSLIIASQRPADVSPTILSQCANFLIHRIQNPDDIDYFKKILPAASRDLLDQLPILAPGDGLLLGSAVNIPARVKIRKPDPEPSSETPKPWKAWQKDSKLFDYTNAIKSWTQETIPIDQAEKDEK
jgi:uncharacterized protein